MTPLLDTSVQTGVERFTDSRCETGILEQYPPCFANGQLWILSCSLISTRGRTYLKPESRKKSALGTGYWLGVAPSISSHETEHFIYTKSYLDGRSRDEFSKIPRSLVIPSAIKEGLILFPEQDMVMWVFPNGPALPHLPEAMISEPVMRYLPPCLLPDSNSVADIFRLTSEVVNYRPESDCTIRYHAESPRLQRSSFYGKPFRDWTGLATYNRMLTIWKQSMEQSGPIIPQPLGYPEKIHTLWQESGPEVSLLNTLNSENFRTYIEQVAQSLVWVHRGENGSLETNTMSLTNPVSVCRKTARKFGHLYHFFIHQIETLMDYLEMLHLAEHWS